MKRGLLIGGGIVVVVVVGVIAFVALNINPIVKDSVETYGSEITKVAVSLNEVDISPVSIRAAPQVEGAATAGLAQLPRLADTADEVRSIAVALGADLTRDVFTGLAANEGRVKTMTLSGYRVIAFATHGLVPGDLNGLAQPALALSAPAVAGGTDDGGKKLSVKLPSIHLKDIGKDKGGASPGEVVEKIMASVTDGATKAVGSLNISGLIEGASGMVKDVTKGATDAVKDLGKNLSTDGIGKAIGGGASDATKAVEEGAEKVGKALEKLFGK